MTPPNQSRRDGRIPEIDGLRAFAILTVMVWHWVHLHANASPGTLWAKVQMLLRLSWSGVDLFFVLSGFLVGGILLAQRESPDYFRTFYGRRVLRIFPLYFAFLGVCLILRHPACQEALPSIAWIFKPSLPVFSYLTFTQNLAMAREFHFANSALNITWSLAVEEQFYLLLPVLIRWVPVQRLPAVLILLMVAGAALRAGLYAYDPGYAGFLSYVLLPCRWDPLFLGVIFAWILRQPDWTERLHRQTRWMKPLLFVQAGLLAWLAVTARGVIMSPSMTLWGYPFLGLFYTNLVVLVILGGLPWLSRCFRNPFLLRIGTISYGIYLFHETVSGFLHQIVRQARPGFSTPAEILTTILAAAVSFLLADLSWRWFEKRFVDWGHRHLPYRRPAH